MTCPCHEPRVFGHLRLTCPQTAVAAIPIDAEPEAVIDWASKPLPRYPMTISQIVSMRTAAYARLRELAGRTI